MGNRQRIKQRGTERDIESGIERDSERQTKIYGDKVPKTAANR